MDSLYAHIEQLGRAGGYKNMTVFCKAAGVPRTTMSELNAGRSKDLSKPNAQKFADLLGISLDGIYGSEQKETPTGDGGRGISDNEVKLALFGGSGVVTDEMWNEALFAVELIKKRHEKGT